MPWFNDVAIDPIESDLLYAATPWGVYVLDTDGVSTAIEEEREVTPTITRLMHNYPNPFNSATVIPFSLERQAHVRLEVFAVSGQRVRVLVNKPLPAGSHQLHWDGKDDHGRSVASGVYLYRLTPGVAVTHRMVLLK